MGRQEFDESLIHGYAEAGFEKIKREFIRNFKERKEIGAACSVYHKGKKVVDFWGGYRDKKRKLPWEEDTLVPVFSTSKGISGLAMAVAHSKGLFDYDEKISKYWPEFAQNGKDHITIRQLLSHQAGVCAIDEKLDLEKLADPDALGSAIAKQKPLWEPGTKHGYHGITLGFFQSQIIRRTDPKNRTIGKFLLDELAKPLDLEFYIGLPPEIPRERIAKLHVTKYYKLGAFFYHLFRGNLTLKAVGRFINPKSISRRTFANPKILGEPSNYNLPELQELELPSANGIGQVRSIAKAYGEFATGGKKLGIKQETLDALINIAPYPRDGPFDEVMLEPACFSLGFIKPTEDNPFGTNEKAFGTGGLGGSIGFADPESKVGFAYAPNKLGFDLLDPRREAMKAVIKQCISDL